MTEAEFTQAVLDLAAKHHVLAHHDPDSRRSAGDRGFPDLVLAGTRHVLFVELKLPYGHLSPEQTQWRYSLRAAGVFYVIWRPYDLECGHIEKILKTL